MNKKMITLEKAIGALSDIEDKDCMRSVMKAIIDNAETVTFQDRPPVGERIKAFYVQRIRRGSHGPLSSEMRWSPEMGWSRPRYRRVSLFLRWRLHAWFPFLFRPRRYGTLPDQMGTSHIKKIEVPRD